MRFPPDIFDSIKPIASRRVDPDQPLLFNTRNLHCSKGRERDRDQISLKHRSTANMMHPIGG
jgi:hypothetical protein